MIFEKSPNNKYTHDSAMTFYDSLSEYRDNRNHFLIPFYKNFTIYFGLTKEGNGNEFNDFEVLFVHGGFHYHHDDNEKRIYYCGQDKNENQDQYQNQDKNENQDQNQSNCAVIKEIMVIKEKKEGDRTLIEEVNRQNDENVVKIDNMFETMRKNQAILTGYDEINSINSINLKVEHIDKVLNIKSGSTGNTPVWTRTYTDALLLENNPKEQQIIGKSYNQLQKSSLNIGHATKSNSKLCDLYGETYPTIVVGHCASDKHANRHEENDSRPCTKNKDHSCIYPKCYKNNKPRIINIDNRLSNANRTASNEKFVYEMLEITIDNGELQEFNSVFNVKNENVKNENGKNEIRKHSLMKNTGGRRRKTRRTRKSKKAKKTRKPKKSKRRSRR